jgi:hypothetical protein
MTASNIAIESGKHDAYITMTRKIEKTISKVINNDNIQDDSILFDAKCTQSGHTGTVFYYLSNNINNISITKSNQKYVLKTIRKKLFNGSTLPCLINALNDDGTENTNKNAIITMYKLAEHLTIAYNNLTFQTPYNIFSKDIIDLIKFYEILVSVYTKSLQKYITYNGIINDIKIMEYNNKIKKQYEQNDILYIQLAKRQYNEGLYKDADINFQLIQNNIILYDCSILYWHIHTIISLNNNINDNILLSRILKLFNEYNKCFNDNDPSIYINGYNKEHMKKLNDFKKQINKN